MLNVFKLCDAAEKSAGCGLVAHTKCSHCEAAEGSRSLAASVPNERDLLETLTPSEFLIIS